jgi:hypothetical protein
MPKLICVLSQMLPQPLAANEASCTSRFRTLNDGAPTTIRSAHHNRNDTFELFGRQFFHVYLACAQRILSYLDAIGDGK